MSVLTMKKVIAKLVFAAAAVLCCGGAHVCATPVSTPTIMDFQAKWCRPCRAVQPVLAKIGKKYAGRVKVVTVDVDDPANQELVEKYGVTVLPTIVFLGTEGDTSITTGYTGEVNIYWGLKNILR